MPRPMLTSAAQWWIVLRRQFTFYLRSYRFIGLVAFVAVVSTAVLALQLHAGVATVKGNNPTVSDFLTGDLGLVSVAIILVAAFLGGDAIAIDFGTSSGYYMLVLPVRRIVLLAGRFVAALLATILVGLVYFAFTIAGAAYFYGAGSLPGYALAQSLGLAALFALASLAVAFFFSSFFRTPAVGMIVTVLVLYLGLDIVTGVVELAGIEPWFSLLYGSDVISQVFNPAFVHSSTVEAAGITITTWRPFLWEGVEIMLGYLAVFLAVSTLIYERKESKG